MRHHHGVGVEVQGGGGGGGGSEAGVQEDLVHRVERVLEGLVMGSASWLGGESAFFREHSSDSEFYLDVDLGKEEEVDIFTERLKGLVM